MWRTDWRKDLALLDDYPAYRDRLISILTKFVSIQDGHLGSINALQHRIKTEKTDNRSTYSDPHWAGRRTKDCERQEINQILVMDDIEPTEMELALPIVFVTNWDPSLCFRNDYCKLKPVIIRYLYPILP